MSLFPFIDQEPEEKEQIKTSVIPEEYEMDFKTYELTGRIVKGKEAIKMWIYKVLRTNRYKHIIYTWDYGVELEELISRPFDRAFIESEVQRYIKEALLDLVGMWQITYTLRMN